MRNDSISQHFLSRNIIIMCSLKEPFVQKISTTNFIHGLNIDWEKNKILRYLFSWVYQGVIMN